MAAPPKITLFPYHRPIPLFCPLFSNSLLSFISSVENGISCTIHSAVRSVSLLPPQPAPPSPLFPFNTFILLSIPLNVCFYYSSHLYFLPVIPSMLFRLTSSSRLRAPPSLLNVLFFPPRVAPSIFSRSSFFSSLALSSFFFFFCSFPSCRCSPQSLNLNIRLGFISMTFMAAKPFIPDCLHPPLLLSLAVFPFARAKKSTLHGDKVMGSPTPTHTRASFPISPVIFGPSELSFLFVFFHHQVFHFTRHLSSHSLPFSVFQSLRLQIILSDCQSFLLFLATLHAPLSPALGLHLGPSQNKRRPCLNRSREE